MIAAARGQAVATELTANSRTREAMNTMMLGFTALAAVSSPLAPYLPREEIRFCVTGFRSFRAGPLARMVSRRRAVGI
jgi:hypothetical protein